MYNSIYPSYVNPYVNVNNRQIQRKQDDEKSSQSSKQTENNPQQNNRKNNTTASYFPTGEKVAIDYTKRQINIDQVLTDFKNTANAIGAPDEIKEEVSSYLSLISTQSQKDNPNKQIIQSNLKNASQILDEYITNTLKKPSKVVENWVDALFMQQIDYKTQQQPSIQNQEKSILQLNQNQDISEVSTVNKNTSKSDIYIPSDPQLKRMFIQAKKYAAIDNKEKALNAFQNTLDYAQSIGEGEACAIVHYEQGLLYDNNDDIEKALYNYNNAAKQSSDNNIKAKAHIKMGKIYDDFVKFESAVDHYCAAVSFAGESDNLKLQSQALSDLAQIHAERYDKTNALTFMSLADTAAEETKDKKVIGLISSKNGKNCERLNENSQALKYYSNSAKSFYDIDDNINLAKKYQSAALIMLKYGNSAKAKNLLSKAFVAASSTSDSELKSSIATQIANLNNAKV